MFSASFASVFGGQFGFCAAASCISMMVFSSSASLVIVSAGVFGFAAIET